jgi:glycosyltransferase involved in cell wall biosynthesis
MSNKELAIVIPAYKGRYLKETLDSLVRQSNQNFHVYLGDDHSPEDLYGIIEPFLDKLKITYHKFPENMGKCHLISHWNRSIAMTNKEPWLWLFSDDDLMDEDCVESFYYTKSLHPNSQLYRFSPTVIDAEGKTEKESQLPARQTASKLLKDRLLYRKSLFIVDGIFSRNAYNEYGIIDFPAAWCSDDATWICYGQKQGIVGITRDDKTSPRVYWRYSGVNISSLNQSSAVNKQKLEAVSAYKAWLQAMKDKGTIQFNALYLFIWSYWMKTHILKKTD